MKIKLIGTPNCKACITAAGMCYNAKNPYKALMNAMQNGHESVAEHATFSFLIEGISRVTLAQLTRHRLASFSVQSQRYCGADLDLVIPESIKRNDMLLSEAKALADEVERFYHGAVALGVPPEDARYFTLQAGKTRLVMTMNIRELRHFFALRCCNRAQWEIRELANEMLELCKAEAPDLFKDAGPGCVRGACPEGDRSCRKKETK